MNSQYTAAEVVFVHTRELAQAGIYGIVLITIISGNRGPAMKRNKQVLEMEISKLFLNLSFSLL